MWSGSSVLLWSGIDSGLQMFSGSKHSLCSCDQRRSDWVALLLFAPSTWSHRSQPRPSRALSSICSCTFAAILSRSLPLSSDAASVFSNSSMLSAPVVVVESPSSNSSSTASTASARDFCSAVTDSVVVPAVASPSSAKDSEPSPERPATPSRRSRLPPLSTSKASSSPGSGSRWTAWEPTRRQRRCAARKAACLIAIFDWDHL
mmetsp:Transcript_145459/g.205971  ORF Transcript_145459/g.205971 Transcript_145459/m.205971 type:complete len:204 (-) Transcript_145459:102-713(-)